MMGNSSFGRDMPLKMPNKTASVCMGDMTCSGRMRSAAPNGLAYSEEEEQQIIAEGGLFPQEYYQ